MNTNTDTNALQKLIVCLFIAVMVLIFSQTIYPKIREAFEFKAMQAVR